jgi:hypothetical protein
MLSIDDRLAQITASKPVSAISDVIAVMQSLDALLPDGDGLKWFNLLYLKVTEDVFNNPLAISWERPGWLERLDVVFAHLYFSAIANWITDRTQVARSWTALLESRNKQGIMPVQFALAGMNAHINHDLPIALVQTGHEQHVAPRRRTPEYRDYQRVNAILDGVQEKVKHHLAIGIVGALDRDLGRVDDMIANWNIRKARETAWSNADILWRFTRAPALRTEFLTSLDRLVSLGSHGLLVPVG